MKTLATRGIQAFLVAVLIGAATFAMMRSLPGDAALPAFLSWLDDLLRLVFGTSLVTGQPVIAEITHQLGASLALAAVAAMLSLLIGPPLGILAGLRPGGVLDRVLLVILAEPKAVPQILMALILILILSVQFRVLPAAGHGEVRHFILPALALALGLAAVNARIGAMPFYSFAPWKGLSPRQTLLRHGLRNVSVPLLIYLGLQFVTLVEGVVVVEAIFGWPGIGHALVHAIFSREVQMVQGTALVLGLSFVLINAIIDVVTQNIDPRRTA